MGFHRPCLDGVPVWAGGQTLVVEKGFQFSIECQSPVPPVSKGHVAPSHSPKPLGRFALNRKLKSARREEFKTLKAQPGAVHCILRVVAEVLDELLALSAPSASVATTTEPE
jgi:hypothetical protein